MDNSWPSNGNSESETKPEVNSKENNENNLKNISPYMSKDLIAAAGFNVETPIVNAIIGNLTGSLPTKKSETEMIKCEICDCELSSDVVLSFHINGSKHKKRLKALEIIAQLKDAKDKGVQLGNSENPNAFRCEICSLTVNSAQQLEIHLSGTENRLLECQISKLHDCERSVILVVGAKHKKKAAKAGIPEPVAIETSKNSELNESTDNSVTPPQPKKKKKDEPAVIPCNICNVFMNSKTQYHQHLLSRKHLSKTSGKQPQRKVPGKGKFAKFPYIRTPGTQFQMNSSNHICQNESNHYNAQTFNRLLPYSNFIAKSSFCSTCKTGDNNPNSFKQPKQFQKRF